MNNALDAISGRAGKAHLLMMLAVYTYLVCPSLAPADEPETSLQRLASFTGPEGWIKEEVLGSFGEPRVLFSRGSMRSISIQLFGTKDSKFTSIEAYMQSLQARGLVRPDLPPTPAGDLIVGDKNMPAYGVKSFAPMGDPHNPHDAHALRQQVEETFVMVPAK